ncbi:glycosyltransferase [Bradyrhizobium erythrophlei]|uniref:Glycosyl transferase family 2 n=1 Tax=Bradyrhizobium erythrophlei TaxID=1437360 RepID=A0A1H5JDJ4_9BRAD|nr:glycosyltransferase [Bradyrhizobium erythrophlei]SEE50524.1 Glycosyl transferase family 2 [Bradyrhizobium erythrophlei]
MAKQTVCLSMIVKNEAPVIERCLRSVLPLIDTWIICDTGSTDGTQDIIRSFFAAHGKPGELHQRPWKDFAHNRSEALTLARNKADYSLIIDADDAFEIPVDNALPNLTADSYTVDIKDSSIQYQRTQLVRNALPWCYRGVLHEFLSCDAASSSGHLPIIMRRNHDGARRRDPNTYRRDAAILEAALQTETDPFMRSRYTFYLAQSWRDCREPQKALSRYLERAELGFWTEEAFYSLYQAANLKQELKFPPQEVIDSYKRAADFLPGRAEALHGASRFCRLVQRFEEGYRLAQRGIDIPLPASGLFVENWIYQYGLRDELAINAYWSDHYKESLAACQQLLSNPQLPAGDRARIEANEQFAKEKLAARAGKKIAVYAIALNEAAHVERWCRSAVEADVLIVADTGSTDNTVAMLQAAGVVVHRITVKPWRFDHARNASLALIPEDIDICIALDMDEVLVEGWRQKVLESWNDGTTRLVYNFARGTTKRGHQWVFRAGKIHSRADYRWKRAVHEDLEFIGANEKVAETYDLLIAQQQDEPKNRTQYLPLMELALEEDPADAQMRFWLARELMYVGRTPEAAAAFHRYLSMPWHWQEERSEAMRLLARLEEDKAEAWLQSGIAIARHRRELWLDLSELYHSRSEWINLLWSCSQALHICRRTGSYLDDPNAWGFRIDDLIALAYYHLGLPDKAIEHGEAASHAHPGDPRLVKNLGFYRDQLGSVGREYINKHQAILASAHPASNVLRQAPGGFTPDRPLGGTELMIEALHLRLGSDIDKVDLRVNYFDIESLTGRPLVLWMHHNSDQEAVQWCSDPELVSRVTTFVFVSHWQLERYKAAFGIPPHKCVVLRNATAIDPQRRAWKRDSPLKFAYTSTPFRGLSVLLDAWDKLDAPDAELHVWSSMRLYAMEDHDFSDLISRASDTPGVIYHGLLPNEELKRTLRDIHFLAYPSIFEETSCLAVIDAMAAGCRVIVPDLGALPETTAGFARVYRWKDDPAVHATEFARVLRDEIANPWRGRSNLAQAQQDYCAATYSWDVRKDEWKHLISRLSAAKPDFKAQSGASR